MTGGRKFESSRTDPSSILRLLPFVDSVARGVLPAVRACVALSAALLAGCAATDRHDGWFALQLMELPAARGPSTKAVPEDVVRFDEVLSYTARRDSGVLAKALSQIREGDVIAYRMSRWDTYRDVLFLKLNKVGYGLFKYGHLAIVVRDPATPGSLKLFSSQSFRGANVREGLETLAGHDFDVYRLDQWQRVDRARLDEFVTTTIAKAGGFFGYDFLGMFGLANSNLRPSDPASIGYDYICSTVVVSALYYAGVELDAIQREGVLDLVTPAQVVNAKGRIIALPRVEVGIERGESAVPVAEQPALELLESR